MKQWQYKTLTNGWPPAGMVRNIPAGTVPFQEGSDVIDAEREQVGQVEQILMDCLPNHLP